MLGRCLGGDVRVKGIQVFEVGFLAEATRDGRDLHGSHTPQIDKVNREGLNARDVLDVVCIEAEFGVLGDLCQQQSWISF